MDYKEKLELAKDWYNDQSTTKKEKVLLENLFPELKMSEDEMIRKEVEKAAKDWYKENYEGENPQGKALMISAYIDGAIAWLEKQGEQKPVNKVEPKFKVGDWIVEPRDDERDHFWHITTIDDENYWNGICGVRIKHADEKYHLWTIADAKDGDVLASMNGCPFIYKKSDGVEARFYCCVDFENCFCVGDGTSHCGFKDSSKPATKEQCDLLFKKMREAGYEWDAEKKELKKIDKKELRKIDSYCQENCKGFQETGKCYADGECKAKKNEDIKNELLKHLVAASNGQSMLIDTDCYKRWATWVKEQGESQPHWKPTEEQMNCFKQAIDLFKMKVNDDLVLRNLNSLYNDLKTLKL